MSWYFDVRKIQNGYCLIISRVLRSHSNLTIPKTIIVDVPMTIKSYWLIMTCLKIIMSHQTLIINLREVELREKIEIIIDLEMKIKGVVKETISLTREEVFIVAQESPIKT